MNIQAGLAQRFAQMAQNAAGGVAPRPVGPSGPGGVGGAGSGVSGTGGGDGSFGDALKRAIDEVSATQDNANEQVNAFLRGEPVELHQVMAASEEAGIAVEMLVEIRNKFTEAYRTVINMQS